MSIRIFNISGYGHFYRSLLRFYHDVKSSEAAELTYTMYTANLDSYRHKNPDADITEAGPVEFHDSLTKQERRPYRTEIQLYRAMEALMHNIVIDTLSKKQLMALLELLCMMDNTELRFYRAFDMEIDDARTVYRQCVRNLVPRGDEPGVCLMQDWINLPSA